MITQVTNELTYQVKLLTVSKFSFSFFFKVILKPEHGFWYLKSWTWIHWVFGVLWCFWLHTVFNKFCKNVWYLFQISISSYKIFFSEKWNFCLHAPSLLFPDSEIVGDSEIAPISWFLYAIAPKKLYPKNSAIAPTVFNCADFSKHNFSKYNFSIKQF